MNTDSTVTEHEHVKTSSWAKKKKITVTNHEHVNTPLWKLTVL